MTLHRKRRLRELINTRFGGVQLKFAQSVRLSEGRITQLLDPEDSFGERSAKKIQDELRLGDRYFEQGFPANDDYMQIARLTVTAGAGGGRPVYAEDIVDGLAFRRDFLRGCGINSPDDASVIGVRGLSMGEWFDGAVVLVNRKARDPVKGKIFAFFHGDGPVVKRVVYERGEWLARSDNEDKKNFPDFGFEEDSRLIGMAVWMGSKL